MNWFQKVLHELRQIVVLLKELRGILQRRSKSATLNIIPSSWDEDDFFIYQCLSHTGRKFMSATLKVGGTATAVYKEFTGPNGSGDEIAPIQQPQFSSSDESIATVDSNGFITAVAPGTVTITGTDAGNGLSASDSAEVQSETPPPVAQSATLTIVPN